MPEFRDLFPRSFKARDFRDAPQVYTIAAVEPRVMKGDDESVRVKLCVKFAGSDRFWLAGPKEACPSIAEAVGSTNTDDWIGSQIELYEAETDFGGEAVDCVRARRPSSPAPAPAPAPKRRAAKRRAAKAKAKFPAHVGTDGGGDELVQLEEGGEIYQIPAADLAGVLDGSVELEDF
jgi:hypothetical protein